MHSDEEDAGQTAPGWISLNAIVGEDTDTPSRDNGTVWWAFRRPEPAATVATLLLAYVLMGVIMVGPDGLRPDDYKTTEVGPKLGCVTFMLLFSSPLTNLRLEKVVPGFLIMEKCRLGPEETNIFTISVRVITSFWLWAIIVSMGFSALGETDAVARVVFSEDGDLPIWLVAAVLLGTLCVVCSVCNDTLTAENNSAFHAHGATVVIIKRMVNLAVCILFLTSTDLAMCLVEETSCGTRVAKWRPPHVHHYQLGMIIIVATGFGSENEQARITCSECVCSMLQGSGFGLLIHGLACYGYKPMFNFK